MTQQLKLGYFMLVTTTVSLLLFGACDDPVISPSEPIGSDNAYVQHLTNQINGVIIPAMESYQARMTDFQEAVSNFSTHMDEDGVQTLREAYEQAYLAYQTAAVHNFYATVSQGLVINTNLYPINTTLLNDLIEKESYHFNTTSHERANGFPALDYLLYGMNDVGHYYKTDSKRLTFLTKLVESMKERSDALVENWSGNLKINFIENGGTALGSSISKQLNESMVYYEEHIRENKVGIPIGRLGPLDTPIEADATKTEAYYQSLAEGDDRFALQLVKAAVEEMEDFYLGETTDGVNGQGYDDLLLAIDQPSVDADIKAQFDNIYETIHTRKTISGDDTLYESIHGLVTLFKSDLFPVLNVQDADGGNDGD